MEQTKLGFKAYLKGYWYNNHWFHLGQAGLFWSSTSDGSSKALRRYISYFGDVLGWYSDPRSGGSSVRCLKD
ncbi:MAG: hypothetical protein JW731_03655 [Bacteroidales bacterium]|nr:hypothetical protein [Bacteroidales bacterium]